MKRSRLHCITPRQGRKNFVFLSEERLSPREVKPCGFVRHFFCKKKKNGGERGNRRRSEATTSTSIADHRARSAGQPTKKSRFLRHAESTKVKIKKPKCKFTCKLGIYCFYSDFLSSAWKKTKKMAEREGNSAIFIKTT